MFRKITLCSALLLAVFFGWGLKEGHHLKTSRYLIPTNIKKPIKIVHLSDLHFHHIGSLERKLIDEIGRESPDIILVTGDTLDSEKSIDPASMFFQELKSPPLGIWAVLGNWENWRLVNRESIFSSLGVQLLVNDQKQIRADFFVEGFDDEVSGSPIRMLVNNSSTSFCVALFHSPEFFDSRTSRCLLSLAGHTHGGQIKLPGLAPFWLPEGSGKYISGWYNEGERQMYVSRGIGTSILPVRFFVSPELVVITLVPK